ncbi:MAG: DMT family transporter [Myxococcaceae bacterium]
MKSKAFILAAALLWSTAGVAVKLSSLSPWQLSAGRSLIAAVTLLLVLPEARRWPSRKGILVAFAYATSITLFVIATKLTTAANAIFLQDTAPLHVMLLSTLLLKERPTRTELLSAPVFLIGLGLFFVDQLAPGQRLGNIVALVASVVFAFTIVGLRAVERESPSVLAAGNSIAAIAVLPLALTGPAPSPLDLSMVGWLGISLAFAYVFFSRGLREASAVEGSLLMLIEPVLSAAWTFLIVGERMGGWAIVGGAVILGASVWRTFAGRVTSAPSQPENSPHTLRA